MAIHEAMLAHGLESPWAERLAEWKEEPEWDARITTRVPCAAYFGVRDQALLAHATQIDPDGFWFAVPRELQRTSGRPRTSSWSRARRSELPEDDLFAGVHEEAETLGA